MVAALSISFVLSSGSAYAAEEDSQANESAVTVPAEENTEKAEAKAEESAPEETTSEEAPASEETPAEASPEAVTADPAEEAPVEEEKEDLTEAKSKAKEEIAKDFDKKQSDKTLEDYNKAIDDAKTQEEIDAVVDEVKALPQKEEEKSEEAANAEEKASKSEENASEAEDLEISEEKTPESQEAGEKVPTSEERKNAKQSAENWDEEIAAENNYWKLPEGWKGRNIGGVRGTGAALSEVNYLGTYTDENDRDVLRLEWKGDIGASATYLNKTSLAFKFDKDLYDKIDWERSFGASAQDKESKFQFQNVNTRDYQAELSLADMTNSYTGALYQLPVNLVLKEGVKLSDLGNRDFLIQHRAIEPTNKFVWTNVPGTLRDVDLNEIQYNQYTKSTVIPGNSNIKNDVIPSGVQNNDHVRLSYGTSEYDSAKKTLRVDLKYRKHDSTTYGGNFGLVQSFDARLLDLLEEDEQGNVAYVNVLDTGNDKAYKNVTPIGISREQINVKDGVATIYVVGQDFKSNIEDSGIKVVRT